MWFNSHLPQLPSLIFPLHSPPCSWKSPQCHSDPLMGQWLAWYTIPTSSYILNVFYSCFLLATNPFSILSHTTENNLVGGSSWCSPFPKFAFVIPGSLHAYILVMKVGSIVAWSWKHCMNNRYVTTRGNPQVPFSDKCQQSVVRERDYICACVHS